MTRFRLYLVIRPHRARYLDHTRRLLSPTMQPVPTPVNICRT